MDKKTAAAARLAAVQRYPALAHEHADVVIGSACEHAMVAASEVDTVSERRQCVPTRR